MRSPNTIGLDAPGPGIGVFQAMFSDSLHLTGSPLAELTPIPLGPRKPDHSGSAPAARSEGEFASKQTATRISKQRQVIDIKKSKVCFTARVLGLVMRELRG